MNRTKEQRNEEASMNTFVIGDKRTLKGLHQNQGGEETSARSYLAFIVKLLVEKKGVLLKEDVYKVILDHYGPSFGPDDRRHMNVGRGGTMPKWRNQVAWALVMGQRAYGDRKPLFKVKKGKFPAGRKTATLVILLDPKLTPPDYLAWALAPSKRKKRVFTKSCPECGLRQALALKVCVSCGQPFPTPTKKIDKLPR
jgi:hypothetical protein